MMCFEKLLSGCLNVSAFALHASALVVITLPDCGTQSKKVQNYLFTPKYGNEATE